MGCRRTWTDDDLRSAVASASTMAEVVRRLRLKRGGAAYVTVRTRMEQLGLGFAPSQSGGGRVRPVVEDAKEPAGGQHRPRTWTEAELQRAVREARSLNDVFTRLGLAVGGSQWLIIRSLILEREWPTAHWDLPLSGGTRSRSRGGEFRNALDAADLSAIVERSRSRAEVIRALGFEPTTSTYRVLKEVLRDEHISIDHFESNYAAMRRARRSRYRRPLEDVLVRGSSYNSLRTLKQRLVEADLMAPECATCGIDQWCGQPIVLHLDHINGIRNDHRLENLRLLCPNCHSQTDTYCGRNQGAYGT